MKQLTVLAIAGLIAAGAAQAEVLSFTNSTIVPALSSAMTGQSASGNLCALSGVCSTALSFNTVAGGKLTVTAADGADVDTLALVNQSRDSNAGLGVVTGYAGHTGTFLIVDGDYSLSAPKETLTLSFAKAVNLSQLYFFPNDRSSYALTHELDSFDGFTLSVDGGAAVEYGFGSKGGQPVTLSTPLQGHTFTFGYARKMSPENYYLAGLSVSAVTPAVPEAGTIWMMGLGFLGLGALGVRRSVTRRG